MFIPVSGQIAKLIASKKRTRKFHNIFWGGTALIVLLFSVYFFLKILPDHIVQIEEQTFVQYENGKLITEESTLDLSNYGEKIYISNLINTIKCGDKIKTTTSLLTGELIEIEYDNVAVYRKRIEPLTPLIIAYCICILPALIFTIFMLIVLNIKKPGKFVDKIQRKILLQFNR